LHPESMAPPEKQMTTKIIFISGPFASSIEVYLAILTKTSHRFDQPIFDAVHNFGFESDCIFIQNSVKSVISTKKEASE